MRDEGLKLGPQGMGGGDHGAQFFARQFPADGHKTAIGCQQNLGRIDVLQQTGNAALDLISGGGRRIAGIDTAKQDQPVATGSQQGGVVSLRPNSTVKPEIRVPISASSKSG